MNVEDKLTLVCLAMKLTQATQAALQQYKERGYDPTLYQTLSKVVTCTKSLDEYLNVGLVSNIAFASVGQINKDYEGLDELALVNAVDFAIGFQNDVLAYIDNPHRAYQWHTGYIKPYKEINDTFDLSKIQE